MSSDQPQVKFNYEISFGKKSPIADTSGGYYYHHHLNGYRSPESEKVSIMSPRGKYGMNKTAGKGFYGGDYGEEKGGMQKGGMQKGDVEQHKVNVEQHQ